MKTGKKTNTTRPRSAAVSAADLKVMTAAPPPPYPGWGCRGRSGMFAALLAAANSLAPGAWFEWPHPPRRWRGYVQRWKAKGALGKTVRVYPDADGRVIVTGEALISTHARVATLRQDVDGTVIAQVEEVTTTSGTGATTAKDGTDAASHLPTEKSQRAVLAALLTADGAMTGYRLQEASGCRSASFANAITALKAAGLVMLANLPNGRAWELTGNGREAAVKIKEAL